MTRLLLLLLTLLLPLQFSWAALSPYCGDAHETLADHALHEGHGHPPHAQADAAEADAPDDAGATQDCGHCHGHLTPLPQAEPLAPRLRLPRPWPEAGSAATPARTGPRPERPQWLALA